jgi:hypothetical protein
MKQMMSMMSIIMRFKIRKDDDNNLNDVYHNAV